jgi:hypothetical protein
VWVVLSTFSAGLAIARGHRRGVSKDSTLSNSRSRSFFVQVKNNRGGGEGRRRGGRRRGQSIAMEKILSSEQRQFRGRRQRGRWQRGIVVNRENKREIGRDAIVRPD